MEVDRSGIFLTVLFLMSVMLSGISSFAQNRLSVSSTGSVYLDFKTSYLAGQKNLFMIDDSKWLNYTILVTPNEPTYSISVQIVSGIVPSGVDIKLKVLPCTVSGKGIPGTPVGEIRLSHIPQVIIDNIGTCFTGSGTRTGHQLIYSVDIKDYDKLQAQGTAIYLLFTITP
ncbi:MAG: hypothetical protein NTW49_00825 [Bacteroidia bacterium]|nr:hypothetical protein [Bacteroidia bacterium]